MVDRTKDKGERLKKRDGSVKTRGAGSSEHGVRIRQKGFRFGV
jgi:hypothetical protein